MRHFEVAKTLNSLHEHFYWTHIKRDVECIYNQCIACRQAKFRVLPHSLYTPLPVLTTRWIDISMNFMLGFLRTKKDHDSIFIVVDWFSKMT